LQLTCKGGGKLACPDIHTHNEFDISALYSQKIRYKRSVIINTIADGLATVQTEEMLNEMGNYATHSKKLCHGYVRLASWL
jgi:hypothetical protein